jgi:hypothetical protein
MKYVAMFHISFSVVSGGMFLIPNHAFLDPLAFIGGCFVWRDGTFISNHRSSKKTESENNSIQNLNHQPKP